MVAYTSYAPLTPDAPAGPNVYVRDRQVGHTELVSDRPGQLIGMASDGRHVVWASADFNAEDAASQVFSTDRLLGITTVMTPRDSLGSRVFPPWATWSLSSNGQYLVFSTPDFWWLGCWRVQRPGCPPAGRYAVYLADLENGTTVPVTADPANNYGYPSVSDDGRVVGYMDSGRTHGYVIDRSTQSLLFTLAWSTPLVSPDGRTAAYTWRSAPYAPTEVGTVDLTTRAAALVTAATEGQFASAGGYDGAWSADSSRFAFVANYAAAPDGAAGVNQLFVRELATGATNVVPLLAAGVPNGDSLAPALANDGSTAFVSAASNLVPDDGSGVSPFVTSQGPSFPWEQERRQDVYVQGVDARTVEQQLADLAEAVSSGSSLLAKVNQAVALLSEGNPTAACKVLRAFILQVEAQDGKSLTHDDADTLSGLAEQVASGSGCP